MQIKTTFVVIGKINQLTLINTKNDPYQKHTQMQIKTNKDKYSRLYEVHENRRAFGEK